MTTRNDNGPQGYCGFEVGQHVVCVDDKWHGFSGWHSRNHMPTGLTKGKVYTVERVYTTAAYWQGAKTVVVCLSLKEAKKEPAPASPECDGWHVSRFRPLPKLRVEDFLAASTPKDVVSA